MHKPQIITRLTYTVCVCSLFFHTYSPLLGCLFLSQITPLQYANRENYNKAANDGRC